MKTLYNVALTLVIVGALNWLLIGLFNFDLVATLFGANTLFTNIIYTLVGICGLFNIGILFNHIEADDRRPVKA